MGLSPLMLSRPTPTLVRTAENRFLPGSSNRFSPQRNPYSETGMSRRQSRPAGENKEPEMQAERDPAPEQDEQQAKTGFLHAVAGLVPNDTADTMYMVGYDEGTVVRAQHLAGQSADVLWLPLGPRGVRAVGSLGHEAVALPDQSGWEWWITDPRGVEVTAGRCDEVDTAQAAIEAHLASLSSAGSLSAVLADVLYANPDLPGREALRLARRAQQVIAAAG